MKMNHFIQTIQCAKLSLTSHFQTICNKNPPVEIIDVIMQLLVDTLRVSIYCHKNKYHVMINKNVYGISYQERVCHNLYKVANMKDVKKIIYGCNYIYFISYDNVLYSISKLESRDITVKKIMTNVVDIKYSKFLLVLTENKKLITIVNDIQYDIYSNVIAFDRSGRRTIFMYKNDNSYYFRVDYSIRMINFDFNVVSIKRSRNDIYLLTDDGIVHCYDFNRGNTKIITLPKIDKMEASKYGIAFLDIHHHVHVICVFGSNIFNEPKLINLDNVIDVHCDKEIMLLTNNLKVYITKGQTIERIFSFNH
jgi:hypothetical protein